jgi:hypothetical protein
MDNTTFTDPVRQPIAGTEMLGYGLNPFGDLRTVAAAVCDTTGTEQEVVIDNKTYYCARSIKAFGDTSGKDKDIAFFKREEYQTEVTADIKAEGKYGAFSGRFHATFGSDYDSLSEHAAALKTRAITLWTLRLDDLTPIGKFKSAAEKLPDKYEGNEDVFYRFFQTWGAFVVTQVTVGGSMEYALLVDTSRVISRQKLTEQVGAEYGAIFKGSGTAEQRQEIKRSTGYTSRTLTTIGGDTKLFNMVNLLDPQDYSAAFTAWSNSIASAPKVVLLEVKEITAFIGTRAAEQALAKYLQSNAMIQSNWTESVLSVAGDQTQVNAAASGPTLRIVLMDRTTLRQNEKRFPAPDPGSQQQAFDDFWAGVHAHLAPSDPQDQMLLVATERWPRDRGYFPSAAVQQDLLKHGASEARLNRWEALTRYARRCPVAGLSYALAGSENGRNTGVDALAAGFGKPEGSLQPTVRVSVLLPHSNNGKVRTIRDEPQTEVSKNDFIVLQSWTNFPLPVLAAQIEDEGNRLLLVADDPQKLEQYWYMYSAEDRYGYQPKVFINYLTCGIIQAKVGGDTSIQAFQRPLQDDVLWAVYGDAGKTNLLLLHYHEQNWNLSNNVGTPRVRPWYEDWMYWQRVSRTPSSGKT